MYTPVLGIKLIVIRGWGGSNGDAFESAGEIYIVAYHGVLHAPGVGRGDCVKI